MDRMQLTHLEIEPGHTVIAVKDHPNLAKEGLHALLDYLQQWRHEHPDRVITDLQMTRCLGVPRSIALFWYTLPQVDILVDVMQNVLERYGKEYIEAIANDAHGFLRRDNHPFQVAAMISKREIVAVVDKRIKKCWICVLDDFLSILPVEQSLSVQESFAEFQNLKDHSTVYHIVPLPDDFQLKIIR